MTIIYKITNKINGKIYVGKTNNDLSHRFKEHQRDAIKPRCNKRPLYSAINKYGISNFIIEIIEECDNINSIEREIYWINFLISYGSNGYNATKGGDGKTLVDYELILNEYSILQSVSEVSLKTNCSTCTVRKILKQHGFDLKLKGTNKSNSFLTEKDVINIRKLYIPKKFGKRRISKKLGLPLAAVSSVIENRSWNHIQG